MTDQVLTVFSFLRKLKINYLIIFILSWSCAESTKQNVGEKTDFCASIHPNDSVSLSDQLKDVKNLMQTKTGVYCFRRWCRVNDYKSLVYITCRKNNRYSVFYFLYRQCRFDCY